MPTNIINKPKNLIVASDAAQLSTEQKNIAVDISTLAAQKDDQNVKENKKKQHNKKQASSSSPIAPFIFKSKTIMMLQEKENSIDLSTGFDRKNDDDDDDTKKVVAASKAKGKGKGKGKSGKKTANDNYFDNEEDKASKRPLASEININIDAVNSSSSTLNSSVSSIASVLSSGKSSFKVPRLKKK